MSFYPLPLKEHIVSTRTDITLSIRSNDFEKREKHPKVSSYFGSNTFSESIMKKMLSEKTFSAFKLWQEEGVVITGKQADEIADAMKEWARRRNAVNRYYAALGYARVNLNQKPWCEGPYGRERVFVGAQYENRNLLTTRATARLTVADPPL